MSSTSLRRLLLFRHAESLGNIGQQSAQLMGDANLSLSPLGYQQAHALGLTLGRSFFLPPPSTSPHPPPLIYLSPYTRTRQTLRAILRAADVPLTALTIHEDPRLREVEMGYSTPPSSPSSPPLPPTHDPLRETHGWLYYRFPGGESPADCYDRCSSFLASLQRQLLRTGAEEVLILGHGLSLRCLVMRFCHLSVEAFDALENPAHCERIEVVRGEEGDEVGKRLVRGGGLQGWGVRGLRVREQWKDWREEEWQQAASTGGTEQK